MEQVKVVIPFYRTELQACERASLENTMRMFASYPVVWLKPEGLDLRAVIKEFAPSHAGSSRLEIKSVSDDWLGKKRGLYALCR